MTSKVAMLVCVLCILQQVMDPSLPQHVPPTYLLHYTYCIAIICSLATAYQTVTSIQACMHHGILVCQTCLKHT